jgi:hypothetical protein
MKNDRANLMIRVERLREFHRRKEPGDLLVYVGRDRCASLEGFLFPRLFSGPAGALPSSERVRTWVGEYVGLLRESYGALHAIDDDIVPCAVVYWGIGSITAAMTGLEPEHDGRTTWLEPGLDYERIESLRFDPGNKWIQLAVDINRALWACWEEDFFILPYLHRSPLDAANGIRGTKLFEEMYSEPDKVKALADWCADWSIRVENHIREQVKPVTGWGTGVWGTWLPDRSVFVNGDPVCLISPDMQAEFERPSTGRLFTETGGGFFHNHTAGLYQARHVAKTPGLLVQEFYRDPKHPNVPEVLLDDPRGRDELLASSLDAPIMIENIVPAQLDRLLPILANGRFILSVCCSDGESPDSVVRTVRRVSNLK